MHIALRYSYVATTHGIRGKVVDHLKDVSKSDGLIKHHLYFPLNAYKSPDCRIKTIEGIAQQQILANAWQEMLKLRYVFSVS